MTIFSVIFAILLFAIIIILHEVGHFAAAKAFGVQVNEFSLFMGPAIFKKQIGETLYSIRTIPLGGYCAMEGEDEASDNPRSFQNAAWWKRLIILVAGSFMNLLTGLVLLALVFSLKGNDFANTTIEVAEEGCTIIREDGLHLGDELWKVDGYRVYTSTDARLLFSFESATHDIVVKRNGEKIVFDDYPMEMHTFVDEKTGVSEQRYGIEFGSEPANFRNLMSYTFNQILTLVQNVRMSISMLISGKAGVKDLAGPVKLTHMMVTSANEAEKFLDGILNMLYIGGIIAVCLGATNMLPIPALDGGRSVGLLLTAAIEKIIGKKLNPKYEGFIHGIGMILLVALMAFVVIKDVFSIIKG